MSSEKAKPARVLVKADRVVNIPSGSLGYNMKALLPNTNLSRYAPKLHSSETTPLPQGFY
jgi:hypothetical protein